MNMRLGEFILRIPRGYGKLVKQILANEMLLKLDAAWLADLLNLLVPSKLRLSAFNQFGLDAFRALIWKVGSADKVQEIDDLVRALRFRQRQIMRRTAKYDDNLVEWKRFLDRVGKHEAAALAELDQDLAHVRSTWNRANDYLQELRANRATAARIRNAEEGIAQLQRHGHEGILQWLLDHGDAAIDTRMWGQLATMGPDELDGLAVLVLHHATPEDLFAFTRLGAARRNAVLTTLVELAGADVEGLDKALTLGMRPGYSREGFIGQLAGAHTMLRKYQHENPRIRLEVNATVNIGGVARKREIDVQVIVGGRTIDVEVKTLVTGLEVNPSSHMRDQMRRDLVRHIGDQFRDLHWGVMKGAPQNVSALRAAFAGAVAHPDVVNALVAAGHTAADGVNWLNAAIDDLIVTLI